MTKELAHVIMETGQPKIWCSSSNAVRQENLLLKRESAFCSSQSTGWMRPIHTGEGSLPDSAHQFTCSSYPQTPSQTHQNNVRINKWAPWPVRSTCTLFSACCIGNLWRIMPSVWSPARHNLLSTVPSTVFFPLTLCIDHITQGLVAVGQICVALDTSLSSIHSSNMKWGLCSLSGMSKA